MKRWVGLGLLIAVVLGGVILYANRPGVPVDVAVARRGTIRIYVEERGKTRLPNVYRVAMPLSGRIQRITFREGDVVTKNGVLARMEEDELKTNLSEARSRLAQFEQLVEAMVKTVAASEAQRDSREEKAKWAKKEFDRLLAGYEKGSVTPSQKDAAELQKLESVYEFLKERFNVQAMLAVQKALELGKGDADVQFRQKQRDYDRAVIRSNVTGVVLKRYVSNPRYLPAGELLLEIGNLRELEIEADVLTQQAVEISDGGDPSRPPSEVEISGPAVGPVPVRGRVWKIFPQGFQKTSSLGVEQQRVRVIIRFDKGVLQFDDDPGGRPVIRPPGSSRAPGRRIGVDYRVRVRIYTNKSENALLVPRSAVFRDADGNWQAFLVRNGLARRVTLRVGLMNDHSVEVIQGIGEGDRVILAPDSTLSEGDKVTIR